MLKNCDIPENINKYINKTINDKKWTLIYYESDHKMNVDINVTHVSDVRVV